MNYNINFRHEKLMYGVYCINLMFISSKRQFFKLFVVYLSHIDKQKYKTDFH